MELDSNVCAATSPRSDGSDWCPTFLPPETDAVDSSAGPPSMGPRLTIVSRILGGLVASIGTSVLVGWALDIPVLKSVHPQLISMKPNTALAFVLLGMALAGDGAGALQRSLAKLFGALVALLGLVNLIQYEFGVDLHIDGVLFREPAGTLLTTHPGRLSFIASMGLMLLGAAVLLSLGFRRAARLASSFAAPPSASRSSPSPGTATASRGCTTWPTARPSP